MEDMSLGRIAALVPEFAVKDLPLGRTLMMMMKRKINPLQSYVDILSQHSNAPMDECWYMIDNFSFVWPYVAYVSFLAASSSWYIY